MGIRAYFRELFQQKPAQGVIAKVVPTGNIGRDLPNLQDVKNYAEEGYRRNAIIYACVNLLARTATQPKPVAGRANRDGEIEPLEPAHPLAQLLRRPNSEQSWSEWVEQLIQHYAISGNSFTHKARIRRPGRNGSGRVIELWHLRPDRTRVVPNAQGFVEGYKYPVNGVVPKETIPAKDVMHLKALDPLDDYYGLSPIHVLAGATDTDNEAQKYIRAYFTGGAQPGGWLVFNQKVDAPERERVLSMLHDAHGRNGGWHTWGVLDADVKWEKVGSTLDQLKLDHVFSHTETRICAAFGVHPILIAAWAGLERSTLANYETALKDFWIDTASPLYRRLADKLTHSIASEFGEDLVVEFDFSDVPALQEDRESQYKRGLLGWKEGILSLNEARELFGVDAVDDEEGDERKPIQVGPGGGGFPSPRELPSGQEDEEEEPEERQMLRLGPGQFQAIPADREGFPNEDIWLELHKEADKAAPKIKAAFNKAVRETRVKLSLKQLASALSETDGQDKPAAEAMVIRTWEDVGAPVLSAALRRPLTRLFEGGVDAADADLPEPEETQQEMPAEAWAIAHIAELVTNVSEQTRDSIRLIVQRMFTENLTPQRAAKHIREFIGLNRPQTKQVMNEWARLTEEGLAASAIDEKIAKLTRRLIRERADMIARTEGIRALSAGQEARWNEAAEEGLIDRAQVEQFWIITSDDRTCPICLPMGGQAVELGGDFITGDGRAVKAPPDPHPLCRCARAMRRKEIT